jgi:uncharacterized membrane protein YhaH (DUF805 family)
MDHSAAAAGMVATFFLVYGIVLLALVVFMIWVYWRIFTKAGYNGALAFLNFVPGIGSLICVIILAFGRWPIEDQLAALHGTVVPPGTPPPAPPGSTIMPTPSGP